MKKILIICTIFTCSLFSYFCPKEVRAAAKWPDKPLIAVIPWGAGGSLDVSARLLAKYWEKELGVAINIENRIGADGQIGIGHFSRLPADGESLLFVAQPPFSSTIVFQGAPYSLDDFSALACLESDSNSLGLSADSPYGTFEEINAAILANPGKFRIASNGRMIQSVLFLQHLKEHLNWDLKVVTYAEAAERQAALMGGHLDIDMAALLTAKKNGQKVILVWDEKRHPLAPDAPTLNEVTGKKLPSLSYTRFVLVHSSLKEKYPDRFKILHESLENTWKREDYQQALRDADRGNTAFWMPAEEAGVFLKNIHALVFDNRDLAEQ